MQEAINQRFIQFFMKIWTIRCLFKLNQWDEYLNVGTLTENMHYEISKSRDEIENEVHFSLFSRI